MAGLMRTWVERSRWRPALTRAANAARRQLGRIDNAEVRKARRLAAASRSGAFDVLYLGDSTVSWVAPYDTDRRTVDVMIDDLLPDGTRLLAVHGGSYNAALYRGFVRMLDTERQPPLVILPLCVRLITTPWILHPVFGHRRATTFLNTVDPAAPLWRIRKGFEPASPAEFEEFYAVPHPTWEGDLTIGDYVLPLKSNTLDEAERVSLLYSYHHGGDGRVAPATALEAVRGLGEDLRRLGAQVVVYQTPVPVQAGVELHGPAFRKVAETNFGLLEDAFTDGFGPVDLLRTGMDFATEEFIDRSAADEHLNERGRQRLAGLIASAARDALRLPEPR